MEAIYLLVMMNMGTLTIREGTLKTAVINLAGGTLTHDQTQIVRSCAFTITDAQASITLPSEESEYHLDYVQNRGSLAIAGTEYTKSPGEYGNPRAKRRIIFSGGSSTASINFTKKADRNATSTQQTAH